MKNNKNNAAKYIISYVMQIKWFSVTNGVSKQLQLPSNYNYIKVHGATHWMEFTASCLRVARSAQAPPRPINAS